MQNKKRVGFIGLGVMGQAMAQHLLDAGYPLFVYNRTQSKAQALVELGAKWCESPCQVASETDVVLTIVGYPSDVEAVYLGEDGLFAGSREGQIFVDLTTSSPKLAIKLSERGQEKGVKVLDAPVSGGDLGAKRGSLTAMVGGDQEGLEAVESILKCFSHSIVLHGGPGSGQHAKASNQIMIAGTMTGMVETLCYARANGLDLDKVIQTLTGGAANNWSLANYGPRILNEDYSPGFFVKHYIKDLGIALESELELPGTQLAYDLYQKLSDLGYADAGTQALIKLWWKDEAED